MILWIDSDASYLSESKARPARGGPTFFPAALLDPPKPPLPQHPEPTPNAPVHVLCSILREIASSAAEAEVGGLPCGGKAACPARACLEELGRAQPPAPVKTDNTAADGIANDTVKQKRSKAIDVRCCWARDRARQGQLRARWRSSGENKGDYFTKHFPGHHHQTARPEFLHQASATGRRGSSCRGPLGGGDGGGGDGDFSRCCCFTAALSSPTVKFSPTVQLKTFDPEQTTFTTSADSREGVLTPDIRVTPASPGSPARESLGVPGATVAT